MESLIVSGFGALTAGVFALTIQNVIMITVGCVLLWLGVKKDCSPLLLLPIGFAAILVNMPLSGLMEEGGLFRYFYNGGVLTEIFPCVIFIGIGVLTDFSPLLANPKLLLLGVAGQFGIFLVLLLSLAFGFNLLDSVTIGIIGACDGPTAIFFSSKFAPHLLAAVSVAAYSYMSLVGIIQPIIIHLLTTEKERHIEMDDPKEKEISRDLKIIFPVVVTIVTCLLAPMGAPLIGTLMLGNLIKESGVVPGIERMVKEPLLYGVTLFLGVAIGATMQAGTFLEAQTLKVLGLGFLAICFDTVAGIMLGKLMCFFSKGKVSPLIGACGISAFPLSAQVIQRVSARYNPLDMKKWLLSPAMTVNTGGQICSVIVASILLSIVLKGVGM